MKKDRQKTYAPDVFEEKEVRGVWHNEQWHFAVVDVVAILTRSVDPGAYWRKLERLSRRWKWKP